MPAYYMGVRGRDYLSKTCCGTCIYNIAAYKNTISIFGQKRCLKFTFRDYWIQRGSPSCQLQKRIVFKELVAQFSQRKSHSAGFAPYHCLHVLKLDSQAAASKRPQQHSFSKSSCNSLKKSAVFSEAKPFIFMLYAIN